MDIQLPQLSYSKNWEDAADFPTKEYSEVQVRADIMFLYTQIRTYINMILIPAIQNAFQRVSAGSASGGSDGAGGGSGDLTLDQLYTILEDYLMKRGGIDGIMTGFLTLSGEPILDAHAATKKYVDSKTNLVAEDAEKGRAEILVEVDQIKARVEDTAGNYSEIVMTPTELYAIISKSLDEYSRIIMKSDELIAQIIDAVNEHSSEVSMTPEQIYAAVTDMMDKLAEIIMNDSEIIAHITDGVGDTNITITPEGLQTKVDDEGRAISEIVQNSTEIMSRVIDALTENMTQFGLTANEIRALAESITKGYKETSEATMTAEQIQQLVKNELGEEALLRILSDGITQIVKKQLEEASLDISPEQIAGIVKDELEKSSLIMRKDEIEAMVSDETSGRYSTLRAYLGGIFARVQDAESKVELSLTESQIQALIDGAIQDVEAIIDEDGIVTRVTNQVTGQYTALTQSVNSIEQKVQGLESQAGQEITESQIRQWIVDEGGSEAFLRMLAGKIKLSVSQPQASGSNVTASIGLEIGPNQQYGQILLTGNVDVSGQVSADALYSNYGEVANLAVDQLTTARKIVNYLAGDTSDVNYVKIYQQYVQFVTGETSGGTEQATNPDGELLYWPVDVSGLSRGTDGYPLNDGVRVFTTTNATAYPVTVYSYTEAVKRQILFSDQLSSGGVYEPLDIYGAGNANGNNIGYIYKGTEGFEIRYVTPDGKQCGIRMTTGGEVIITGQVKYQASTTGSGTGTGSTGITQAADGYLDITGLRKTAALDFSGWTRGIFSETVDGSDSARNYAVSFDGDGKPVKITDASGHETAIAW